MLNVTSVVADFRAELESRADPVRASHEKSYMKSELLFIGVRVPEQRAIIKVFARNNKGMTHPELWSLFEEMWQTGLWEMRMMAICLLDAYPKLLGPTDLLRLRQLVVESACWAFNDWIGAHLVGDIVRDCPAALLEMDRWAVDNDLWVRRVAMQSLLVSMGAGDLGQWPRFVRYSEPLLESKDFWTRKVIGWILREVSKKNPEPVAEFLMKNRPRLAGLTLQEGAKYLSPDHRMRLGLRN